MGAVELKPCPFCGGKASIERYGNRGQSTIYRCDECSCSLETGEERGHGSDWNRRTDIPTGFVILSPDEVRGIREAALEEAAKVAEAAGNTWSGSRDAFQCTQEAAVDDKCEEIADAIRSLCAKEAQDATD